MKKHKRPRSAAPLIGLPSDILQFLLQDFESNGRTSDDLHDHYIGPRMDDMLAEFVNGGSTSRVDYDLAVKELEEYSMISTGPMEPYDNKPGSSVFVFAFFSKRDYAYLTEDGYREARRSPPTRRLSPAASQTVHISGGNFYQSPVGIGGTVSQQINFDVGNETDSINYLAELLAKAGQPVEAGTKKELASLVSAANAGNMAAAKPIFHKIFGAVEEPIKQLAYGVITAIITNQMGLS